MRTRGSSPNSCRSAARVSCGHPSSSTTMSRCPTPRWPSAARTAVTVASGLWRTGMSTDTASSTSGGRADVTCRCRPTGPMPAAPIRLDAPRHSAATAVVATTASPAVASARSPGVRGSDTSVGCLKDTSPDICPAARGEDDWRADRRFWPWRLPWADPRVRPAALPDAPAIGCPWNDVMRVT